METLINAIDKILANNEITCWRDDKGYYKSNNKGYDMLLKLKSMYIYGKVGVGKTYQMLRLVGSFNQITYAKWNDLINANLKRFNNEEFSEYDKIVLDFKSPKVYIIDDFMASSMSATQMELIFRVIDYRLENKLITIITGNYSLQEMTNKFRQVPNGDFAMWERIASRMQMFKGIEFKGVDKRKSTN